jgi:hypothetical protein
MPCSEEHLKKLDSMMDTLFGPKKPDNSSVSASPSHSLEKDCKPFSDNGDAREELRQGALSKEQ